MLRFTSSLNHVVKRTIHSGNRSNSLWVWGLRSCLPPVQQNGDSILHPTEISEHTILGQVGPKIQRQMMEYYSHELTQLIIQQGETITGLAAGWGHSLIATVNEKQSNVHSYGLNRSGQLGNPSANIVASDKNAC